ncbi:TPA: DNA cytosine methyltransferase [Salmonella enterica]|nr:DNA cytosine methyltransferase [Salmonella enterica subsp. enterica serovar Typhimurium]HAG2478124.1 DNA cytosine methyltransferase [Salmonella enterica]
MTATAYYNEIDPFAAAWLQNLIDAGCVAPGVIDTRSIEEVTANDLKGFTQCHFFAGIGVWSYALRRAGWPDSRPVWTGSCPCQPFSQSGKRRGFNDPRHLWPAWFYLVSQCRPHVIFGEQVASKDGLTWFDAVQFDLEKAEYAVAVVDLCAACVGAPHIRQRLYWVGDANDESAQRYRQHSKLILSEGRENKERYAVSSDLAAHVWSSWEANKGADEKVRVIPACYGSPADGVAGRVGQLRAYGNAIVAPVAEAFIRAYMEAVTQ